MPLQDADAETMQYPNIKPDKCSMSDTNKHKRNINRNNILWLFWPPILACDAHAL